MANFVLARLKKDMPDGLTDEIREYLQTNTQVYQQISDNSYVLLLNHIHIHRRLPADDMIMFAIRFHKRWLEMAKR